MTPPHPLTELQHDPDTDHYWAEFDDSPCVAVPVFIETITGRDATRLDPLNDVIDPDALDRILTTPATTQHNGDRHVTFTYAGYTVTMHSYGVIEAVPADTSTEPHR